MGRRVATAALSGALLAVVALVSFAAGEASAGLPRFSSMVPAGSIAGWTRLKPAPKAPDTRYTLVTEDGTTVVRADADASMSGLAYTLPAPITGVHQLRWRWRIERALRSADLETRAGDDYTARVYVLFDYPRERLPFTTRAKLALAEALYGQPIPTAALNYVWDNRAPIGTLRPNAYTDRARMIVVESGNAYAGTWREETRDLDADFRAAFGAAAPPVVGVAIATDTDNTGERATAWYGDLELH